MSPFRARETMWKAIQRETGAETRVSGLEDGSLYVLAVSRKFFCVFCFDKSFTCCMQCCSFCVDLESPCSLLFHFRLASPGPLTVELLNMLVGVYSWYEFKHPFGHEMCSSKKGIWGTESVSPWQFDAKRMSDGPHGRCCVHAVRNAWHTIKKVITHFVTTTQKHGCDNNTTHHKYNMHVKPTYTQTHINRHTNTQKHMHTHIHAARSERRWVHVCVTLSVCVFICACPSVCLSACLSEFPFVCRSVSASVCVSVCVCGCMSVCVHLFFCLRLHKHNTNTNRRTKTIVHQIDPVRKKALCTNRTVHKKMLKNTRNGGTSMF